MKLKALGLGETLWDLLPSGPQLGGAPANFACHAQALGARAGVITRVGNDDRGRAIARFFQERGIDAALVQTDAAAPTGTVTVTLSGQGIPNFTIHENSAWDRIEATPVALAAVTEADAICFGSLAQRSPASRAAIQEMMAAARPDALRIFDINLRQTYFSAEIIERSLRLANILKLNEDELRVLAGMFRPTGNARQQIEHLARQFNLQLVALTRGADGSALYRGGAWTECASPAIKIIDTVGAGDAFTAALALGLLRKMDLAAVNVLAGEVAACVCACAGATPPLPQRFADRLAAPEG